LQAIREAEQAFAADDYDRAEHLAEVVLIMMRRDTVKFQANPKAWIAKMREAAAAPASERAPATEKL
jgi:hypothetical protein